jgi:hypothetical protein
MSASRTFDDLGPSRREVVKGGAAAALAAAIVPVSQVVATESTGTVSGTVYENRSGGVRRETNDPGVAGVLVSNGYDVVKTDAAGRYTLPVDDEGITFVIKPTGYTAPVDEQMLPRFYCIHQPAGSPQSRGSNGAVPSAENLFVKAEHVLDRIHDGRFAMLEAV